MTDTESLATAVIDAEPAASPVLPRGASVGRYVIVEMLGRGGMGVVYKAYDPDLNRGVAVKLVAIAEAAGASVRGRERLLREAQALAQLSHPNVLPIFDVGHHGDAIFLATELVDGETLRRWLRRPGTSSSAVVQAFVAAGEGLSAAHRAGIVHRDFKPDNVMMGRDGRVRVLDFGLARAEPGVAPQARDGDGSVAASRSGAAGTGLESRGSSASLSDGARRSLSSEPVTLEGVLVGTPQYMAPEQYLGEPATAKSDQFAFCVSLYEALYGERPFEGRTVSELRASTLMGKLRPEPKTSRVPRHLRKALLRGLRRPPAERYPSMDALLEDLRRDPSRTARRIGLGVAFAALSGVALASSAVALSRRSQVCSGGSERFADAWNEERRRAVVTAFQRTGKAFASASLERVVSGLDAYRDGWVAAYRDVCEATHVRKVQSAERLDQRMACLGQRLRDTRSLVHVLASADPLVVERAVPAVEKLAPVDACAEGSGTVRAPPTPPSPSLRARLEEIGQKLADARAHQVTGKPREGLSLAAAAVKESQEIGEATWEAQARLVQATFEDELGMFHDAAASLRAAWAKAETGGDDATTAAARTKLVWVLGERLGKLDAALELGPLAEAMLARVERPDPTRVVLESALGTILMRKDQAHEALGHTERALELARRTFPPGDTRLGDTWNAHGNVLRSLKRTDEARRAFLQAKAIWASAFGAEHPAMIVAVGNLAIVAAEAGDDAGAIASCHEGAALVARVLGEKHPQIGSFQNNAGYLLYRAGRFDEARDHIAKALALWEETLGPESPKVAMALHNLALVETERGRLDEAKALLERGMLVREKAVGAKSPSYADDLAAYAHVLSRLGDRERAAGQYHKALAIFEETKDTTHVGLADAHYGLGQLELDRHHALEAQSHFERAREHLAAFPQERRRLARVEAALARSILLAKGDATRAGELTRSAVRSLEALGPLDRAEAASLRSVVPLALARER